MSRALALVESADEPRKFERPGPAGPLLETKLFVPRARTDFVPRPRLADVVRAGVAHRLTVIVAPAGFGKTTLLAGWLGEHDGASVGWVSLDASENEPRLFWSYVIAALDRVHRGVGARASALLHSAHAAPEAMLTALINDIDAGDADFTLVLDDYHVIDAAPIHIAMTFLLDHLPRRMHLVIASRADPPLALPRLRARGELTELRVGDLRFTLAETSAFLNQVMTLNLSERDAATLERHTEGWIAGLKLAALSMKGRDARAFVDAFSGDNRFVADYLVEEVLQAEPERIRRFLLGTAILDRLSGPLCDAVMGARDSAAVLEELERRNLFVVALDDRREWYRYHHLFADVLQRQATRDDPDGVRTFHGRASAWYEEHGSRADAIRHALAAGQVESAAAMLEGAWPERDRSFASLRWLQQVRSLPDDVIRARPVLGMGYAWALLNNGELEAAEPRLRDVERALAAVDPPGSAATMIVIDHARFATLSAELASARGFLAQALGDAATTLEHTRRALELTPEGDHEARITGTALLALALWGRGDLDGAYQTFSEALAMMHGAGQTLNAIRGIFVLGNIRVVQGRLHVAASLYEDGLQLASRQPPTVAPETEELHLGLAELHLEWNDLARAMTHLDAITQAAHRSAQVGQRERWCTTMSRVHAIRGDCDAAFGMLDEAERIARRDPLPRVRPFGAMKARVRIAQGRLQEANEWATRARCTPDDDLTYLREFEHVTLVRLLVARGVAGDEQALRHAARLAERLRTAAETGGRNGSLIEILVIQSLVLQAQGNARGALDPLVRALSVAHSEGYLRVFLDEGTRMRELLRTATARGLGGEYTRSVLQAFDAPKPVVAMPGDAQSPGVAVPLTAREVEILRLIAAGMRNQEIADELSISAATVKRHIANAYGKLGASHRTEALNRANELKLL